MRKTFRVILALLAALSFALVPRQALAGTNPTPDEIFIDGVPLSTDTPKGVSYKESTGTLTLDNTNIGPIVVKVSPSRAEDDQHVDLTIELKGTSIITSKGGGEHAGISIQGGVASEKWANDLTINSTEGGSLTITRTFEQDFPEDVIFYGIEAGGNVCITGKASLSVQMNAGDVSGVVNSAGNGVIIAGIYTKDGKVRVEDEARFHIVISSDGAMHSAGVMFGNNGFLSISTSFPVIIDLTNADSVGQTGIANYPGRTVGVDSSKESTPIQITYCPMVTIKADCVCHTVTGNVLQNPEEDMYSLESNASQYTYVHTYTLQIPFEDVTTDTPHYKDILWLYSSGISTGFQDGTFRPYNSVARCDMAAFLYRLAGEPDYTPSKKDKAYFSDVDEDTPHAKEIWWLAHEGISRGWDEKDGTHTFRPYASIARCDMAAFLMRLSKGADAEETYVPSAADRKTFSDVTAETPHANAIWWLANRGISEGWAEADGTRTFRPYEDIARCDMAAFLQRMIS